MIFLITPYSNQCNINTTISLLISDSASNTTFFPHNIKSDAPFFSLFENPRVLAAVTSMANEQKARKLEVSESLEVPMKFHFKMGFPLRNIHHPAYFMGTPFFGFPSIGNLNWVELIEWFRPWLTTSWNSVTRCRACSLAQLGAGDRCRHGKMDGTNGIKTLRWFIDT